MTAYGRSPAESVIAALQAQNEAWRWYNVTVNALIEAGAPEAARFAAAALRPDSIPPQSGLPGDPFEIASPGASSEADTLQRERERWLGREPVAPPAPVPADPDPGSEVDYRPEWATPLSRSRLEPAPGAEVPRPWWRR